MRSFACAQNSALSHAYSRYMLQLLGVICEHAVRYRDVSYRTQVSCVSCGLLAQNVGSGVMNAWNLSMDGAPMINRTCSAYPRWSAPVALYSRERGAEERGEGRARPPEAGRKCLPSTSSYRVHRDAAR